MKINLALLLMGIIISASSCLSRDDDDVVPDPNQAIIDRETIVDYVAQSGFAFEEHPSGLFYRIVAPGGEAKPRLQSEIEIRYRGELLDGTVFDQTEGNTTTTFILGNLIAGWQIGIPLIGRAGSIELVIPSGLAYGPAGAGSIPPNSVIFFRVDLVDFFN
ncbi:MAG: FKBP-type peptidyl-prolyl cis-trans isomerase [Bacteroidota bacterium]